MSSQQNVETIQMQSRLEGTKRASDFSSSLLARADSTKARSRLSPLWEITSKKDVRSNRAFVFGDCGLVNIAKEPTAAAL